MLTVNTLLRLEFFRHRTKERAFDCNRVEKTDRPGSMESVSCIKGDGKVLPCDPRDRFP